jgi:hypothetical protein
MPVGLPSSLMRGSLPTACELDPLNFRFTAFSEIR